MADEMDIVEAAHLNKSDGNINFLYATSNSDVRKALSGVDTIVGERRITSVIQAFESKTAASVNL